MQELENLSLVSALRVDAWPWWRRIGAREGNPLLPLLQKENMADRLVYVHVRALPLVMVVAIGDTSVRLRGVMLKKPHVLGSAGDVARMHGNGADVVVRSLLANWGYPIVREALQHSVQGQAAAQVLALRAVLMSRLGVRLSKDVPDPDNAWKIVRALFDVRDNKSVN